MRRFVLSAIVMCVGLLAFAQAGLGQEKKRFDVFVYADASVKTPLNALRSELTHALKSDTSRIVNDRTDEILAFLRDELKYQASGMVREDQLIKIGQHFGATTLCVVSVTHYVEYNQYFFEGTIVDMTSRSIVKHSRYPQGNETIQDLSPQTQIKVGNELAKQMELLKVTVQHVSTYTSEKTRLSKYAIGDEKDGGKICYIDNSGEHGWVLSKGYNDWGRSRCIGDEEQRYSYHNGSCSHYGWRIPSLEEMKKIYPNRFRLGLNNTYWTSTRSKKIGGIYCYYIFDFNSGKEKSRDSEKLYRAFYIKNF